MHGWLPSVRLLFGVLIALAGTSLLYMMLAVQQGAIPRIPRIPGPSPGDPGGTPRRTEKPSIAEQLVLVHAGKRIRRVSGQNASQVKFQFKFDICHGLTNQRLQLLDGALVGLFLGAQLMLPKNVTLNGAQFVRVKDQNYQPLDQMFNLTRFETAVQQLSLAILKLLQAENLLIQRVGLAHNGAAALDKAQTDKLKDSW